MRVPAAREGGGPAAGRVHHFSEMAGHAAFALARGVDVYFAHPRSPWERGTNEDINRQLREHFPQSTDYVL